MDPLNRFLKNTGDAIQYVGIAADEEKRLERLDGKTKVSLLEKYGYTEADAAALCKKYGLYSPAYQFSNRNGCWFCPNCRDAEFAEFKRRHPDLWQRLLDLGKTENLVISIYQTNNIILATVHMIWIMYFGGKKSILK